MHAWRENNSFMMKPKEIGWRIGQLRQRMGVEPGKGFFFSGALAIAGKSRRHVSYANQTALHRPPPLHRVFLPPSFPSDLSPFQEREENIFYIYHI